MADEYYNIGPEIRNIDFYIGGINAQAVLSVQSSLSVSGLIIKHAESVQGIQVSIPSAVPSVKIAQASSSIDITLVKATAALEILNILVDIDINTTLTASSSKTAFASSAIHIQSNESVSALKETSASSQSNIVLNQISNVIGIRLSDINTLNINVSTELVVKEIIFASSVIPILSNMLVNPPIRYSPSYVDSASIITMFVLDNKPLTNHGRDFSTSTAPVYIENTNWNNKKSRYYKRSASAGRRTFSLNWKFLPNYKEKTVDNRHARDFLNSIAEDPDVHILKVINQDASGLTPATESTHYVFVRSYSENLIRRDLVDDVYYFDCSLVLEEA